MSAGKGVAEKASRLYSRLSSQTSIAQVSPHVSAVPSHSPIFKLHSTKLKSMTIFHCKT